MKKIVPILLLVLLAACAPAVVEAPGAPAEVPTAVLEEPVSFTWWSEAAIGPWLDCFSIPEYEAGELGNVIVDMWHEEYPEYADVDVEVIVASYSGGDRDPLIDAMIAAGQPPCVIDGYAGRYSSFLDTAIDLDPYLTDEQKADLYYYETGLNYLALPGTVEYGLVNATVLKSVGIEPPEAWTWIPYETFLEWGETLKDNGLYLSCNFCAARSSMQWNWAWFGNAGLQVWDDGYTGIALNTPEAVSVLEELVRLNQEGYFVPGAPGMVDDDCIFNNWTLNKYAYFQGGRLAFLPWFDGAVESGQIPEMPEIVPVMGVSMSGAEGLLEVQPMTNIGFVTMWCPAESVEAATSLIAYAQSAPYHAAYPSALPNQGAHEDSCGLPDEAAAIGYAKTHMMDAGVFAPQYNEARRIFGEYFGAAIRGDITAAEALSGFEADVEAMLE